MEKHVFDVPVYIRILYSSTYIRTYTIDTLQISEDRQTLHFTKTFDHDHKAEYIVHLPEVKGVSVVYYPMTSENDIIFFYNRKD